MIARMPRLSSAIERARRQLSGPRVRRMAQELYRDDKANDAADISTLDQDCQAVYLADTLMMLSAENRMERVKRVHAINAHVFAKRDDERELVMRQARADIIRFGGRHELSGRRGVCAMRRGCRVDADDCGGCHLHRTAALRGVYRQRHIPLRGLRLSALERRRPIRLRTIRSLRVLRQREGGRLPALMAATAGRAPR